MTKIGVLYGRENTFPGALVAKINELDVEGIRAESLTVGAVTLDQLYGYRVILDRISHEIPFYRAVLKHAVLQGVTILNNPFWWSADDKFFNSALARKCGVAVPNTALLPHKNHPPEISSQSLRNLEYPLRWEELFAQIGFPAYLKPYNGVGGKQIYKVHSAEEFFAAYDQTGDQCMILQAAVDYTDYFRCFVVGQEQVRVVRYDPRQPHGRRYTDGAAIPEPLKATLTTQSKTLCAALGYTINSLEFAVQDGVPYAIDFLNPAPDMDYHSLGPANFQWAVDATARYTIQEAQKPSNEAYLVRWAPFL